VVLIGVAPKGFVVLKNLRVQGLSRQRLVKQRADWSTSGIGQAANPSRVTAIKHASLFRQRDRRWRLRRSSVRQLMTFAFLFTIHAVDDRVGLDIAEADD